MIDENIQKIIAAASPGSENNKFQLSKLQSLMTKNRMKFYNNSNGEKDLILHHVHQKYLSVKNEEDVVISGGKNLLYFSIFLSDEYVDLLYMCLKSIIANTPTINFDILFITDDATKVKIEAFDIISKFNVDYMLLSEKVDTGPLASLKKLNIFNYKKIYDYSKILFFDADIICISDLNIIFQKELVPEKLYICYAPTSTSNLLTSVTHGIMHLSELDAMTMNENPDITAFNAGQFLFLNSSRMKNHFSNVIWLRKAWPGEYFYEQSFMNYYFAIKSLTSLLSVKFKLFPDDIPNIPDMPMEEQQLVAVTYNENNKNVESKLQVSGATLRTNTNSVDGIVKNLIQMHGDRTVAIHFVAKLPNGFNKKSFINLYTNAYKLHI